MKSTNRVEVTDMKKERDEAYGLSSDVCGEADR
jgi:hypothetical protein